MDLIYKRKIIIMYKIYKLILNDEVVYIGRTKLKLKKRKSCGYGKNTLVLKDSTIELIEETEDVSRERYWIEYYTNQGCNLYNVKKGDGLNTTNYHKEYSKEYRKNNAEYYKEYHKEYYKENRDSLIEKSKETKERLKDHYKDYYKEYYELNKDKIDERNKKYQEDNKERLQEYRKEYYKNKRKNNKIL